jgi:hypothetical protein
VRKLYLHKRVSGVQPVVQEVQFTCSLTDEAVGGLPSMWAGTSTSIYARQTNYGTLECDITCLRL